MRADRVDPVFRMDGYPSKILNPDPVQYKGPIHWLDRELGWTFMDVHPIWSVLSLKWLKLKNSSDAPPCPGSWKKNALYGSKPPRIRPVSGYVDYWIINKANP
jgi:hypothetical protein